MLETIYLPGSKFNQDLVKISDKSVKPALECPDVIAKTLVAAYDSTGKPVLAMSLRSHDLNSENGK
jgi:hypothetical protein